MIRAKYLTPVLLSLAVVGCASKRQIAIVLRNSRSHEPVAAVFEVNHLVARQLFSIGPFGGTYEDELVGSSMPDKLEFFTVGNKDVINVYAPRYEPRDFRSKAARRSLSVASQKICWRL